jgi:tRNA U34 5-methylaminomethyl-2-thiouridine-forming methyltransferase MnmC
MLQLSALRNIPLRLQPAFGAAKNPLELWQDAALRKLERELPKSDLTRLAAMHHAGHQQD